MKSRLALSAIIGLAAADFFTAIGPDGTLSARQAKSQWDGVYTSEQAKRGQVLYDDQCSSCHGAELNGGERAPSLAGGEFSANWNDFTLGDLFEEMSFSMPQNDPGTLNPQQNADILAYMLHKGTYPTGPTELATDLEVLKTVKFVATKP